MKARHLVSVGIVVAAVVWIGSGYFLPHESTQSTAAIKSETAAEKKLFRVSVVDAEPVPHSRKLVLSGRTEADKKVTVGARTNGVVTELRVQKGDQVKKGDVIAVLSDEARDAQVERARALLDQKRREREARQQLIEKGTLPRLNLLDLEAQEKNAEATLASAIAERDRGLITAPWSGVVNTVPAEIGQHMNGQMPGGANEVAQILALDPIIAVVEVSERKLAGLKVGTPAEIKLVTGKAASGSVRYISKSASQTTRTYRVDVEAANPDLSIPDGITVEVTISLEPTPAARVPRSALIFSSGGDLGVRVVRDGGRVDFVPVSIVEDEQQFMWVNGFAGRERLIVSGQDFVREGQIVEAVTAPEQMSARQQ